MICPVYGSLTFYVGEFISSNDELIVARCLIGERFAIESCVPITLTLALVVVNRKMS